MRRILLICAGVLALLVAVIVALPFLVPVDAYRTRIEEAATAATGRQLKIEGPLHLTIFPEPGVAANKVTLANAPGATAPHFASMESLRVGFRLIPLLLGRLEVSQVTLEKPVIHLEASGDGSGNWVLGGKSPPNVSAVESAGGGVAAAARARFQGVKINDGTIDYRDDSTGVIRALKHINLMVGITSLDEPVTIDGSLVADGQTISLDARITSLKALMGRSATPVDLSLTSDLVQASFKGELARDSARGTLKLDTPSLRRLAAWAGKPLTPGAGLGHLSLEGKLQAQGKTDRFSAIKLVLDKTTFTGALTLDRARAVPYVTGTLAVDDLNLNPYLTAAAPDGTPPAEPAPEPDNGWSTRRLDLSLLRLMNARLTLQVGTLELRKLRIGASKAVLAVNDGALTADLDPVALYGGSGKARLSVRTGSGATQIANTAHFENLSAKDFLSDTLGVNRIAGTCSLTFSVTTRGDTPNAIMHGLNGRGAITFVNGRVHGVDLAHVARTIQTALSGKATSARASTDFTEMGGTFTITNGVLANKDFHLLSPFIRMNGAGHIDLGERTIDFRVEPKAVASIKGQGGKEKLTGLGIPFRVQGKWSDIHYSPDLSGVAKGVIESVKEHGLSTKSVLQGLFGGAKPKQTPPRDGTKAPRKKMPNN